MHLYRYLFIILILIISFLYSCNDNPVSSSENNSIIGKVVDENGNPVEGVNIHYIPEIIENGNLNKPNPSSSIRFSLPDSCIVDLVVLRYGSRDTIAYLIRGEIMNAGVYEIQFNSDSLTNGVYIYVLKYNDNLFEKNMLHINSDISALAKTKPLIKTDANGNFELPYNILAIGLTFIRTSDSSPEPSGTIEISDNITLFLVKEGYNYYFEEMKINTNHSIKKTFILQNN